MFKSCDHAYSVQIYTIFQPVGQTALHVATSRGHAEMVEYLCESGISIDAQDEVII